MRTPAADSTLERSRSSDDSLADSPEVVAEKPLSREERSIRGVGGRVWVVAARMAGILATIAANVIAGRYLSKADFGELSVVLNICTFGSLIAGAGMNRTLVRLIAERLADRDSSGTQTLLRIGQRLLYTSLLATAILFAAALPLIGHQLTGRTMSLSLAVAVAAMVLTFGWHQVVGELLRALHAVRLAALFGAPPWAAGPVVGTVAVAIILGLALTQQLNVATFIWANALAALVVWPVVVWGLRRAEVHTLADYPPPQQSSRLSLSAGRLYALCIPIILTQVLMYLVNQVDVWVAGWAADWAFPLDDVGLYAAAKRIVSIIVLPLQFCQLTASAFIAHLYARGQKTELQRLLQASTLLAFVPSTLVTLAVLAMPEFFLTTLYGEKYAAAGTILQLLAVGNWFNVAMGMASLTLMMTGHEKVALPVNLASVIFMVIAGPWAAARFGIVGLAAAMSLALGTTYIVLWWQTRRYVGIWVHPALSRDALRSLVGKIRKFKK